MDKFIINSDWVVRKSLKIALKFTEKFIETKMVAPQAVNGLFFDIWAKVDMDLQKKLLSQPAVPIAESVSDDYLICLEDGKKVKSLKNYILKHFNMTPDEYRKKWKLSSDYPMINKNFSIKRSIIAKKTKKKKPTNIIEF